MQTMINKFSIFLTGLILSFGLLLNAQEDPKAKMKAKLTSEQISSFKSLENNLDSMMQISLSQEYRDDRIDQNTQFVPQLVAALKNQDSFYYPFDSIQNISSLYSPDGAFRVFTWALPLADTLPNAKNNFKKEQFGYRYYGAIQMNSEDGLKLIPLVDRSPEMFGPEELILANDYWYGAIYYNIVLNEIEGKKYYTVFGWDGNNNITSTIKLMDVISFEGDEVVFGAPIFEFRRDGFLVERNRFLLEFKKHSGVTLNYNPDKDMVIYDYIEPETPEARGNYYLYIPDGTYEGLKFEETGWRYKEKVFNEVSNSPMQLLDGADSGAANPSNPADNGILPGNNKKSKKKKKSKKVKKRKKNG